MGKYATFICSNGGYLPFLNVLLNSFERHQIQMDVYLIHFDFPDAYLKDAIEKFSFPIIPLQVKEEDFHIDEFNAHNKNLFIKQARFKYIRDNGMDYDVICMLDADMFITTPNFMNLFDLVNGTDLMIACNERFKWTFDQRYTFKDKPIFEESISALKFHCSVPIIFDLKKWSEVFDFYNEMALNSFEVDDKGFKIKPIGDIFCWNISVYKHNKQDKVVLFPMETMTQVHHTYTNPWTKLSKTINGWRTYAGDEVFAIHGRIGNKGWFNGQLRGTLKHNASLNMDVPEEQQEANARNILKAIQREWYFLNFNYHVNLYDYHAVDEYWESIK